VAKRPWVTACTALLYLGIAACSTIQTQQIVYDREQLPSRAEVAEVPFFPQERYHCGPAALAMVLAWSGLPLTPDDLVSEVYTPSRNGTLRTDVLAAARLHGRLAVETGSMRDLLQEIAAGSPVLVFQNLALSWYPQWHYAVAIGYDLEAREITLRSGLDKRRVLTLDTFERTWRRGDFWALTVLPPGRLPASAEEKPLLEAAAALERVQRYEEAAEAYTAISARWPLNVAARMGLGNTRYAMGDYAGAERAYLEAIGKDSQSAAAWNNLAYALAAQGRRDEALGAVEKALLYDADNRSVYEDSLRELSSQEM
jgi:tetratricopeptide (TPR) repeat protein